MRKVRRWLFSAVLAVAAAYLGYELWKAAPFVRTVVTALQQPDARTSMFFSDAVWPATTADSRVSSDISSVVPSVDPSVDPSVVPSASDLEIARILVAKLSAPERASRPTIIGLMNDHGVNPSWYRWIRSYVARQPEWIDRMVGVDDAWLLSWPSTQS